MDEKGTTLLLGMIEKGLDLIEVETFLGRIGTLIVEKGTKTLCWEWFKKNKT